MNSLYADLFHALVPETILTVSALLIIGFDLAVGRRRPLAARQTLAVFLGAIGVVVALILGLSNGSVGSVFGGAMMFDAFAVAARAGVLVLVLLTLGVVQLGMSYWLYARAIKHVTALEAVLIPVIEPVLNPIWVLLFVGEQPTRWALAGGIIVVGAVTVRAAVAVRQRSRARAGAG